MMRTPLLLLVLSTALYRVAHGKRLGEESSSPTKKTYGPPPPIRFWRRTNENDSLLPVLAIVASEDGTPASAFPLQICQGDCNRDRDCVGDLKCYKRGGIATIPGCAGIAAPNGTDYCYDATTTVADTPAPTAPPEGYLYRAGNNNRPRDAFPLARCQGDCDFDIDCAGTLRCHQRRSTDLDPIPNCIGDAPMEDIDYCVYADDITPDHESPPPPSPTMAPNAVGDGFVCNICGDGNQVVTNPDYVLPLPEALIPPALVGTTPTCQAVYDAGLNGFIDEATCALRDALAGFLANCGCMDPPSMPVAPVNPPTTTAPTKAPTPLPTKTPTKAPAPSPTTAPTKAPAPSPTKVPTKAPTPSPTRSPTSRPTTPPTPASGGVSLTYVGNNGGLTSPLGKCQSDCDRSSDCETGLICFQRGDSNPGTTVPGCLGTASGSLDYCIDPHDVPNGVLYSLGDENRPASVYPLQACRGDCDSDSDCAPGLRCFDRKSGEADIVPGCSGTLALDSTDYCYNPNAGPSPPTMPPVGAPTMPPVASPTPAPQASTSPGVLSKVGNNGNPSSMFPLARCHGDCDDDSECQTGLVCFQRGDSNPVDTVPGCTGDAGAYGTDYCISLNDVPADKLISIGDNGMPPGAFKLGNCQGDCDNDSECETGLRCFKRDPGDTNSIPGCTGTLARDGTDYCYRVDGPQPTNAPVPLPTHAPVPQPTNAPVLVPQPTPAPTNPPTPAPMVPPTPTNPVPQPTMPPQPAGIPFLSRVSNDPTSDRFPLGKCLGDCDTNDDCQAGLVCFQRGRANPVGTVFGCRGTAIRNTTDFCMDPSDIPDNTLIAIGDENEPAFLYPLEKCRGDCDRDIDCKSGLMCTKRAAGDMDPIPGCFGVLATDTTDYCYDPNDAMPSAPTSPPPAPVAPPTPNPTRAPVSPTPAPIPQPTPVLYYYAEVGDNGHPASVFPLGKCEADCDNDGDCQPGLYCKQRGRGPVDGCSGTPEDDWDYCYDPNDAPPPSPQVDEVGNNWGPAGSFPLGLCEGDCDGDSDCEGELVCHQRDPSDPVPSCAGRGAGDTDYCIHPSDETAMAPEPNSFRLKMYWEPGYDWQEIFWEEEWCFECFNRYQSCGVEEMVYIQTCQDHATYFKFKELSSDFRTTMLQIATTNLCLELDGEREIKIRPCNVQRSQQYFSSGDRFFTDDYFEIQTVSRSGCLTQEHDPKPNERVYRQSCERPRRDHTNFWQKY